jgi:GntR family transcriptional regulator
MSKGNIKGPLYLVVKNLLLEHIRAGRFDKVLPTEHELCKLYNVSRPTIRSALQELQNDNIIKRMQGRGTFINRSGRQLKVRIDKFKGFYQLIQDSGHKPSVKEIGNSELDNFESDYDLPDIFFKSKIKLFERMVYGDDIPAVYLKEFIPKDYILETADLSKLPHSIYDLVYEITGEQIYYTISEIIPTTPDKTVSKLFNINNNTPLVMVKEKHFNINDNVMVYSEVYLNNISTIRLHVLRSD